MKIGAISIDSETLKALCHRWGIAELAAFGSVLSNDFGPESDVDLLVTWKPGQRPPRIFELFALRDELAALLGRPVDLLERALVENDENPYRRSGIISSAMTFYAAA